MTAALKNSSKCSLCKFCFRLELVTRETSLRNQSFLSLNRLNKQGLLLSLSPLYINDHWNKCTVSDAHQKTPALRNSKCNSLFNFFLGQETRDSQSIAISRTSFPQWLSWEKCKNLELSGRKKHRPCAHAECLCIFWLELSWPSTVVATQKHWTLHVRCHL